jgi:hypothetical protein
MATADTHDQHRLERARTRLQTAAEIACGLATVEELERAADALEAAIGLGYRADRRVA